MYGTRSFPLLRSFFSIISCVRAWLCSNLFFGGVLVVFVVLCFVFCIFCFVCVFFLFIKSFSGFLCFSDLCSCTMDNTDKALSLTGSKKLFVSA